MAKAIGLDIGSRAVKLVELDGSPRKFRVTKFISREIPGDGGGAEGQIVTDTVGQVLREGKGIRDTLVAAIDAGSVVIREILIPFLDDDQIRRVLRYEAEAHLHNFAIEDVIVDYVKTGEVQDQSKILVFAAPKDRIRERLFHLNANSVDPMHLGLDLACLFNAAKATGAFERHPNALLIDIGATTTKILIVRDGMLRSVRSLRTGSESLTRALAADLNVDTDSARAMSSRGTPAARSDDLLAPLELPDDDVPDNQKSAVQLETALVTQRQDDFLGRLHRETTRSLATYSLESEFDAIYLTGGASLTGGLDRRLQDRFGTQVIRLDFLGDGDHSVPAADHDAVNAQLGVALGCALKGLGREDLPLEFRREELRYTRKFDLVKVSLATTVTLAFLLLFLTALTTMRKLERTQVDLKYALDYMNRAWVDKTKTLYKKVLKSNAKRLPADTLDLHLALPTWRNQLGTMYKHITNEMGYDVHDIPPIRSALRVWNDFFEKLSGIRDQLGYLMIDDIEVKQKSVDISGQIGDSANVDIMKRELLKIDYVEKIEYKRIQVRKDTGKAEFGMTATLKATVAGGR